MDALLTVPQVAAELAVARKTVYQNWKGWGLVPVRIGGGTAGLIRFRRQDIDKIKKEWSR
jgi:hypothetical protein